MRTRTDTILTGAAELKLTKKNTPKRKLRVFLQCLIAGGYICLVFLLTDYFNHWLLSACLGASAMIVFARPSAEASRYRHIIGGYAVSSVCGLLANVCVVFAVDYGLFTFSPQLLICGLVVTVSMFCMIILDFWHPSGAAFSIVLTMAQNPLIPFVQVLSAVLLLCVFKWVFRKVLIDL